MIVQQRISSEHGAARLPKVRLDEAIIGRPLMPLSYAGVARRTPARAVGVGVAAGAVYGGAVYGAPVVVVAPPMVVAPSCVQAEDPYGRIYTRCY